jgi:hypothetical protein
MPSVQRQVLHRLHGRDRQMSRRWQVYAEGKPISWHRFWITAIVRATRLNQYPWNKTLYKVHWRKVTKP